MNAIWKFLIDVADQEVKMPQNAELLHVHEQHGSMCVWAIVDTSMPVVRRQFAVYGTGHPMTGHVRGQHHYVGTVHLNSALVFHVFDMGETPL